MNRIIETRLFDLIDLAYCACDDTHANDHYLMSCIYQLIAPLSDSDIEAYVKPYYFSDQKHNEAIKFLKDWRDKQQKIMDKEIL